MKNFDVAIVGGGPAGTSLASGLANSGLDVVIFETSTGHRLKIGETLPGSSRRLLESLGFLNLVENGKHFLSYGVASLWGSSEISYQDHIHQLHGLGWHLDRAKFDQDLRSFVKEKGVIIQPDWVKKVYKKEERWVVETDRESIQSGFLVDATGRSSFVSKKLGIKKHRDSDLLAIYGWQDQISEDQETRAFIEARPEGWWYTARIPGGKRVFSYFCESHQITEIKKTFMDRLLQTQMIRTFFNFKNQSFQLNSSAASGSRLDSFFGESWLAVGDAALSFDPLSSQGLYNSLYTGMMAARAIREYLVSKDVSALDVYGEELEKIREAYKNSQKYYYASEDRWPEQKFWKIRQQDF